MGFNRAQKSSIPDYSFLFIVISYKIFCSVKRSEFFRARNSCRCSAPARTCEDIARSEQADGQRFCKLKKF